MSEVFLHSIGEVSEAGGLPQRPHRPSVSVPELLRQSPSNHVLLYRGSDGDFRGWRVRHQVHHRLCPSNARLIPGICVQKEVSLISEK